MNIDLKKNGNKYVYIFADCIPVKGASRSAFYDLTRNEIVLFPTDYFEMVEYLSKGKLSDLLINIKEEEDKITLIEFIHFLYENELIIFVEDASLFPPLQELWDIPAIIQNAIIDFDKIEHDFEKIFNELSELGCLFVQIRSFSNLLGLKKLYDLLSHAYHKSIQSIELIVKYDADISDKEYIKLIEDHPIVSSLVIHSSPQERKLVVDYGCDKIAGEFIAKEIILTTTCIDSAMHCGMITTSNLCAPTVNTFFENKLYNGCLNRKISVDAFGEIKNCPSMQKSYGNINTVSLKQALENTTFKDAGNIKKDVIEICKDCEFRYACTDCRAFTEDPFNNYSKPLKCGYNPYTNEWEEWSSNPLKQKTIKYYGINKNILITE